MLDARFSHLHFCQSIPTPQRGLSAIADLLVSLAVATGSASTYRAYPQRDVKM